MNLSSTRFFTSLILLFPLLLQAQTELSGVINTYSTLSDIDYCNSIVTFSSESAANISSMNVGDAVILIQMQGATIYEERDGNFGSIINMNSAGKYEEAEIASISGNTLTFANALRNTYDLNGGTQLINFPTYDNATVSAPLEAKAWDGATGGILAFAVTGTLTLNASISASESGFKGGIGTAPSNDCTGGFNNAGQVYYQVGSWQAAAKGEGIAAYIPNKENGRGPQANGGGGGNDHNSGGAGGSHATAGGDGGRRETPFLTGLCKGDNPGRKGYALPEDEDRIYLGGGGGAGHTNNSDGFNGGNGGGIVIVQASLIIGNGQSITAQGGTARDISGDGAAGGGAAGTVILIADVVTGDLDINVTGGNGGNAESDPSPNCFGPGGGGSGGRVLTNNTDVNIIANGGMAGLSLGSGNAACSGTTNGAENGEGGRQLPISRLIQNLEALGEPEIANQNTEISACTTQDAFIEMAVSGAGLRYQWQIDRGSGFIDLFENQVYSGTESNRLDITGLTDFMNGDMFRLLVMTECFADVTSEAITLEIIEGMLPEVDFEYSLKPGGVVEFMNTSIGGETFLWNFNGGIVSATENAIFNYPAEGDYPVTLVVSNECGTVSITETINVIFEPSANFFTNISEGCTPYIINFINSSTENATEFEWFFEQGNPATSTARNPSITYNDGGSFDVTLIAKNEVGTDTITLEDYVIMRAPPSIQFDVFKNGLTVILDNITIGADTYVWQFGDGNISTEEEPTHTYAEIGVYTIYLFAQNDCGEFTLEKEVAVGATPLALFTSSATTGCGPEFQVQFLDVSEGVVNDWAWRFPGGEPVESTDTNPVVVYRETGVYPVELIVFNELDQDTIVIEDYIEVIEPPVPMFDLEIDERNVIFTNLSTEADAYAWSFGDDTSTSTEENPVHDFAENGLYFVTLNAYNRACSRSTTQSVSIALSSITEVDEDTSIAILPNPASTFVQIALESKQAQQAQIRLTDLSGKVLLEQAISNTQIQYLDVSGFATGVYFVQVISENWQMVEKLIVSK